MRITNKFTQTTLQTPNLEFSALFFLETPRRPRTC